MQKILYTSNDELQNIFVYQPTHNVIKRLNNSTEYTIS